MPFKHAQTRSSPYKKVADSDDRDWSVYNRQLKKRGDITIWLSPDVIHSWTLEDRIYEGQGTPRLYSDMAIITMHEIRQIFRLPLRQCEGFINGLLALMKLGLRCPSFSTLSRADYRES